MENFFCSFIHNFLGVNNIEDLFCVNFNAKKKKDSLHAIIAYKNYSNTQKGNFSLAPHHLQGRKLTCQLKIKWCLKSLTYLLCNHKSPLAWRCGFANLSGGNERFWQTPCYAGWRNVWQLLSCRYLPEMSTNKGDNSIAQSFREDGSTLFTDLGRATMGKVVL